MRLLGKNAGVFGEPAGVAGTAGLIKAARQKLIPPDALIVSLVTGNGLKDTVSAQKAASGGAALISVEPTEEFTFFPYS
jgi:threonine synthase